MKKAPAIAGAFALRARSGSVELEADAGQYRIRRRLEGDRFAIAGGADRGVGFCAEVVVAVLDTENPLVGHGPIYAAADIVAAAVHIRVLRVDAALRMECERAIGV